MRMRTGLLVLVALAATAAIGWGATHYLHSAEASVAHGSPVEGLPSGPTVSQAEVTNRAITFYEARIEGNPRAAADGANLSGLYLQRSRETGDYGDVLRAEDLARQSLAIRAKSNSKAFRALAASLLAQHRFTEALEVAQELVRIWPEESAHRALLGELQMELGDYAAAQTTFASLSSARDNLAVAPRLARWAEISGHPDLARSIFVAAQERASYRTDFTNEQMAWYHFRLGELDLRNGELDRAEEAFRTGLHINPGDYRILAAMARLQAAREHWTQTIEYGEQAITTVLDPATLGLMSDAYLKLGKPAKAAEYIKVMDVVMLGQEGVFHRDLALFLLDHKRQIPEVSAQAVHEIRTRRDVYGYDLLAWALHKQGRHKEARQAMDQALRMGTRDAMLFYHTGMIERALGHNDAAKEYLRRALEINPRFHVSHPAVAEAVLDSIADEKPWYSRLPF